MSRKATSRNRPSRRRNRAGAPTERSDPPPSGTAERMALGKKLLFSAITVLVLIGAMEIVARCFVPSPDVLVHQEHEQIISVLGLSSLNDVMEFDRDLFWRLKEHVRGVHVKGKIRQNDVDFTVTTHEGLRSEPLPGDSDAFRILALGDSCTFGVGVDDDETWPAQLQRSLTEKNFSVEVINAGVPGYTAYQGKRFLETRGPSLRPDLVVASFGFNDSDLWASRSDADTARELAMERWEALLIRSRLYYGLRRWLRAAPSAEKDGEGESEADEKSGPFKMDTTGTDGRHPRLSPEEFQTTLLEIRDWCNERDIKLVLMIWPFEPQVARGMTQLISYQIVTDYVSRAEGIPCVNLVDSFIEAGGDLFIDHVHANAEGCHAAAEAASRTIVPMLRQARSLGINDDD